jgi:hypothetical protein
MTYRDENDAKASFDDVYGAATPHAYLEEMGRHGYQIGEQARPYCLTAVELLQEKNAEAWHVQMLDVGCSYGLGSAFLKYGCSFEEIVSFFHSRAPKDPVACSQATHAWLNVVRPFDMRVVGLDASANAIQFGLDTGLLDGGLPRNLEEPGAELTEDEKAWVRGCNLMVSTGAIGYVTDRSLDHVLPELGKDHPGGYGPLAVLTILRMFDAQPITDAFEKAGWRFERVQGVRLPQRAFADDTERDEVISILKKKGCDTEGWETGGVLYADLYAASRGDELDELTERLRGTAKRLVDEAPLFASHSQVAIIGADATARAIR